MALKNRRFAYFITPHGYGHAARACAVMNSICELADGSFFELFTQVPPWFFHMSLKNSFAYHEVDTDVGLVQSNSMVEDLHATIERLNEFLPFRQKLVQTLAHKVRESGCEMVVCDIAPLGIVVAQEAGLPSILVENFTWDWIYEGYLATESRFTPYIELLAQIFRSATWHIRTEPACVSSPPADLLTKVASRKPLLTRQQTRDLLGISQDVRMVMITMGGILTEYPFLQRLEEDKNSLFLIPGGSTGYERRGSLVLLPHHSDFYHPDLVNASDALVGKLGYSTLAETYAAGIPFAFVPRARFREGQPMGEFARREMDALELDEGNFFDGAWLSLLPDLLSQPHREKQVVNGADQAARFMLDL